MNRFTLSAAVVAACLLFAGCDAVSPVASDLAAPPPLADLNAGGDDCDDDLGDDECSAEVTGDGAFTIPNIHGHRRVKATFWLDAFRCLEDDDLGDDECDDDFGDDEEGGSFALTIYNNQGGIAASFEADLSCVEVEGSTAWVAGEITEADGQADPYLGLGFFAKVVDNGEPGTGNDQLRVKIGLQYTVADAENDCGDRTHPGNLNTLESGDIVVTTGGSDD
jgi:hypothetical protein